MEIIQIQNILTGEGEFIHEKTAILGIIIIPINYYIASDHIDILLQEEYTGDGVGNGVGNGVGDGVGEDAGEDIN